MLIHTGEHYDNMLRLTLKVSKEAPQLQSNLLINLL